VWADRARLAEALTLFASHAASVTAPDRPLVITTARRPDHGIEIAIAPNADAVVTSPAATGTTGTTPTTDDETARAAEARVGGTILAERLISVQGGSTEKGADAYTILLAGSGTA